MEFRVLTEVLDNLNQIEDINGKMLTPRFEYGTQADLLNYLKLKKIAKVKTNVYPLVWMQTPATFTKSGNILIGNVNFILATISKRDWSNRKRTSTSFKYIIDPLKDEVIRALNYHESTRVNMDEQDHTKYFNYENDLEKGATDIWDATSVELEVIINLNCINI